MYSITLCTVSHYVQYHIMYSITLCTVSHYVQYHIMYSITLCTVSHTLIFKNSTWYSLRLCVVYGPQNNRQLLLNTTLTDWFCITELESVYCAVRTGSLYTTNSSFRKGLKVMGEKLKLTAVHSAKTRRSRLTGSLYSSDHCAAWCHAKRSQWRVKGVVS